MTTTMIPKSHHTRSISLASRPHPLISHVEELLRKFQASQTISSSSSVCNKLNQLKDLYDSADDLLQLPQNKQASSHENHGKCVDGLLDGSLKHLDICGYAKDALSQNKEYIHDLQSCLRRRSNDEYGIAREAAKYLSQRKLIKKATLKAMKSLKDAEKISEEHEISSILSILSQVQVATVTALESLLAFICGPNRKSTTAKWSLVSRLTQSKHISNQQEEAHSNEFDTVDAALTSLMGHKMCIENAQILLGELELSTQDLEDQVNCLFRQLLKLRVSLLNFLSQ